MSVFGRSRQKAGLLCLVRAFRGRGSRAAYVVSRRVFSCCCGWVAGFGQDVWCEVGFAPCFEIGGGKGVIPPWHLPY